MQGKQRKKDNTGGNGDSSLTRLLQQADLLAYESKLRTDLKLRNADDLQFVEEMDLSGIGMSRPEQKRLRKEYEKMHPRSVVGKLKNLFGRSESDKKEVDNGEIEDDQHIISIDKISLCKELGRGEFGSVWQASWKMGNSTDILQVAVKCVDPDKFVATSSSFLQEATIMTKMRHENVVRLYGVVLDIKRVMLVSELASCGSLLECLHKPALRDSFPVHVLCDYAEQICKGMAYLESQRLIHRDLAARNVLVFGPKKVKISDFGLSRSLGIGEDYYRSEFSPNLRLPIAWCAPECINFLKFTSASDVWALGITLWEMFSGGQMPWSGLTGAEILESVDRLRRILPRPEYCPEDIYEIMKECWSHSPHKRPTFAELVVQFPEKQPQTLRAVCDVKDGAADHLSFKKNDLITVIQKAPTAYPDGFYWFGSLKNGKTGLFRPTDTVAHLGAENPTSGEVIAQNCVPATDQKKEKKKSKKEEEREKKKALISEPVGDVRHTCHVGIEDAFGLLQLDKKEVTHSASSPEGRRSLGNTSKSSMNGITNVPLRQGPGREGVTLRDTMSLKEALLPISPSLARQSELMSLSVRSSLQPTAPSLTASAESTMNRNRRNVLEDLDSSLRSLEFSVSSTSPLLPLDTGSSGDFSRPQPICAVYARSPVNENKGMENTSDAILSAEVEHLERDLTEFSLSSMRDRPLLPKEEKKTKEMAFPVRIFQTGSSLRSMTNEEMEKWENKKNKEHKKVELLLSDTKRKESHASSEELDMISSLKEKEPIGMDWSAEAQEAYKLLVECGTSLKQTSPSNGSPTSSRLDTYERKEKRVTIAENKPVVIPPPRPTTPPSFYEQQTSEEESIISYTPQKRVHIIETKLLSGPSNNNRNDVSPPSLPPKGVNDAKKPPSLPPKVRQVPIAVDGRMNYDNLNGYGAGKNPPPVPPKPKINIQRPSSSPSPSNVNEEYNSLGVPFVERTALFSGQKNEEIVKF